MNLVEIEKLSKYFPAGRSGIFGRMRFLHAVDGVSLGVGERETLGLVGESGCGKSTLGRTMLKLHEPSSGTIRYRDADITRLGPSAIKPYRRKLQMIFQDPFASLNPRMTVGDIVAEPLEVHGLAASKAERAERVDALFERVGMRHGDEAKFPGELSGGQRQRVMIAKVLATEPEFVVADEAVSALDVSIRSQILNLLRDVQDEFGMSYLFISHDVAVVTFIADRVAVMYLGRIVESASTNELSAAPLHPYTGSLFDAVPGLSKRGASASSPSIRGEVASAVELPSGCRFAPRCPLAERRCREEEPELRDSGGGHLVACHLHGGGAPS
jgi:oligopeptide/dipeptide ABC transporter ATP-binding protein